MFVRLSLLVLLGSYCAASSGLTVAVHKVLAQEKDSIGEQIGTIDFEDTAKGLKITPNLKGLTVGAKGFHIHEHAACESTLGGDKKWVAAGAAGGHLDPKKTGKHLGPEHEGHLGDLPALEVNPSGFADLPVIAPRLQLADVIGHSVIIHEKGDNYADVPEKLGGGGPRIACGVIKEPVL